MQAITPFLLGSVVLLHACGDNGECKGLRALLRARRDVLASAKAQAGALDKVEKRARIAEEEASKLLVDLGLDDPESRIQDVLDTRARAIPGAVLERSTAPAAASGAASGTADPSSTETIWIVRFKEKDTKKALEHLDRVIATPPLVRFSTILREKNGGDAWRVEVVRAAVDRVNAKPEPVPLPRPTDLSTIRGELGFCGAGRMRSEIEAVDREIAGLEEAALKTTVLLPASATWSGVKARTELLRDTETETRKHLAAFRGVVLESRVTLKAIGVEGSMVVLEAVGGAVERARLERLLVSRGLGEILQMPKTPQEGTVRLMLPNAISEARRRRLEGEGTRIQAPGEGSEVLPADHPSVRRSE